MPLGVGSRYRNDFFYWYDGKYGFGIVWHSEDGYSGFFEDGSIHEVLCGKNPDSNEVDSCVDKDVVRIDISNRYYTNPAGAKKLAEKSKFTFRYDVNKDSFSCVISGGEKPYKIELPAGYYGKGCSCGHRGCVHETAVYFTMFDRLKSLQEAYVKTDLPVNKGLFLLGDLADELEELSFTDTGEQSIAGIREIIKKIKLASARAYTVRALRTVLNSRDGYYYDAHALEDYRFLMCAMFMDKEISAAIADSGILEGQGMYEDRQHKSNRLVFRKTEKEYQKTVKELEKGNYAAGELKEFMLRYTGNAADFLKYCAQGKPDLETEDVRLLSEALRAEAKPLQADIEKLIHKIDRNPGIPGMMDLFTKAMSFFDMDKMIGIYNSLDNIRLSLDVIKNLDLETQKKLAGSLAADAETIPYMLNVLMDGKSDTEKGRFLLEKLPELRNLRDSGTWKALHRETEKLENHRLLSKYTDWTVRSIVTADYTAPAAEDITEYFDTEIMTEDKGGSYAVLYEAVNPAAPHETVLMAKEENGSLTTSNRFGYPASMIKSVCLRGNEDRYRELTEKAEEKVARYHFSEEHEEFIKEYEGLCGMLSGEKIILSESSKAEIMYYFYLDDNAIRLMFKVGNVKPYIVKNGHDFISAFADGATVEYGKDLILTHNTDNFTESDAEAIKLLRSSRYKVSGTSDAKMKRYLYIGGSLASNLLNVLSGRRIFLNDEECTVRLSEKVRRVSIDKDYVLRAGLEKDERFLLLADHGYLITKEDGTAYIDTVTGSAEEMNFLLFASRNGGVSIKPILPDFKRDVYSKLFDFIDVDPDVSRAFRLGDIRINAYFDYENGMITYRASFLKKDRELTKEQVTESADLAKIRNFENYLAMLGFEDKALADESRILSFFKMDFTGLKKLANVYLSENLKSKEIKTLRRPVIVIKHKGGSIMQAFMEKSEYSEEELEKILKAIRKKKKYVFLDKDRIVDLDTEDAKELEETVSDLNLSEKELYRKKEISMVNAIKAFAHERSCRPDTYLKQMIEDIRSFRESDVKIPKLCMPLKNYQEDGFRWLSVLSKYKMGGILADDMGLGKTVQVIALLKNDPEKRPSLIVCPKSLLFNWEREFAKFDGETKVVGISGSAQARAAIIDRINYKEKTVYITSYDSLRNDVSHYTGEFCYGILDEAQYIKNVNALKTKSVKEMRFSHRFALTGTPIENNIVDLWSIFDFIMPGYFEELSAFRTAYGKDEAYTGAIAKKIAPFILRRVKQDVLSDLPPKFERVLTAEMEPAQKKLYDAMVSDAAKKLAEGGSAFEILPYLMRLRQVCVDPGMFAENYDGGSGKLSLLEELIPSYLADGHRILLFSQFVKGLNSVKEMLERKGIPYYMLTGATSAADRASMTDDFNNGGDADVFLISLKAGGTGLNLTGADTVIHLDPWWNVAAENQATDRTHRIGQQKNVEVIKLIAENSIEQRVIELQEIKKDLIGSLISDNEGSVVNANLEDIAFILK